MTTQWVGKTIDGRYVVERVLGEGGMGVVLRAHHQFTGATVAVKLIRPELQLSAEIQQRFLAEARAANAIGHPGIVQVLDAGKAADGSLYLAMELLEGRSLRAAMFATPLAPAEIRRILRELLEVLAIAHGRGFVHRDLKPDNVFLVGPAAGVKLLDFGIAKVLESNGGNALTATGMMMGTPAYMAPEQLRDASSVDARADLWAVGVIAYELVAGRLPFAGTIDQMLVAIASQVPDPIRAHVGGASPQLDVFITRALARDPRARFQSAAEMAAAIATLELPGGTRSAQPAALSAPASWVAATPPPVSPTPPAHPEPPANVLTPPASWAPAAGFANATAMPSLSPPAARPPVATGAPRALKWVALVLALVGVAGGIAFLVRQQRTADTPTIADPVPSPAPTPAPPAPDAKDDHDEIEAAGARRKQSCEDGCRAASACGLAPATCVSRCMLNDSIYACMGLATNCEAAGQCLLREYCGRTMTPRGKGTCLSTITCTNKNCYERNDSSAECACNCVVEAAPQHTFTLAKILMCGELCGTDQACAARTCQPIIERCAKQ